MYFDEDGDLAHEFYEEVAPKRKGGRRKMRRVVRNLVPQVREMFCANRFCTPVQHSAAVHTQNPLLPVQIEKLVLYTFTAQCSCTYTAPETETEPSPLSR